MSDTIDTMYSVANGIAKGNIGYDFIYCVEESAFYQYIDGYWQQLNELEIMKIILDNFNGEDNRLDIRCYTSTRRKQILDNLKQLVFVRLDKFNKLGYLNFDVAEYEPTKDFWHPHKKENYSTLRFDYPFEPKAECPLWVKTLNEIFEGDENKNNMLQEFFGYCLTRDTSQIKALLLLGESNSGKSTILEVLRNVIGNKNCSSVPMKFICNPQYTPLLMNKLVNIDADVSKNAKDFEFEFKIITRGEPISCNQKFLPTFSFRPYSKIVMAANIFPIITDHSSAFYNRLIIIPCDRVFSPDEQNRKLNELLLSELSGIFNWVIEGLKRFNARGKFEEKEFVREAIEDLRDESNPVDVFFRETIVKDISIGIYTEKIELYNKYFEWCRNNGNAPMSAIKFNKAVYQKYSKFTEKKSQLDDGRRVWRHLKYKTNAVSATATVVEDKGWQE